MVHRVGYHLLLWETAVSVCDRREKDLQREKVYCCKNLLHLVGLLDLVEGVSNSFL